MFSQIFILLSLASGTNLAGKFHSATANSSMLPERKLIKLVFNGYICDHRVPAHHKLPTRGANKKK